MASSDNNLSFQQQLDSLSDFVYNTLQQFMIAIDSKLATFRAKLRNNTPIPEASSSTAAPIQDNELFPPHSDNSTLCPIKLDASHFDGSIHQLGFSVLRPPSIFTAHQRTPVYRLLHLFWKVAQLLGFNGPVGTVYSHLGKPSSLRYNIGLVLPLMKIMRVLSPSSHRLVRSLIFKLNSKN